MSADDARKIETVILRTLSERNQTETATAIGVTGARLSRWKMIDSGQGGGLHLPDVAELLATIGLAVVDTNNADLITLSRDEYNALRTLARRSLA